MSTKKGKTPDAFERRLRRQGVEIVEGGSIENLPVQALIQLWQMLRDGTAEVEPGSGSREAHRCYVASILNDRSELRGCDCDTCSAVRADAIEWNRRTKEGDRWRAT